MQQIDKIWINIMKFQMNIKVNESIIDRRKSMKYVQVNYN
jgi:hypothetical protein